MVEGLLIYMDKTIFQMLFPRRKNMMIIRILVHSQLNIMHKM